MHLMNAWRSGDIVYGLPKIDFDELDIKDFTYFTNHKLTREQSQLIINQVHIKVGKIKFSKTGALGQFLCIDSLAIPFATAISIVELHRRKKMTDYCYHPSMQMVLTKGSSKKIVL
ncbi:hypothetical protein HMPREF9372_1796 [Sporosarcina newyorkensis 2681]|uniref:Uncharacterized protein n=1 Tax=Sporosarcina newyorkensis 2681 TaxID=1027292 RepID=F9DSL5_9BACL|nr:hypothetical protein [Sporosarcina newyorkensis]EGQ26206.1 hypothetical protein HMPREF9372_1796 [Sporosarcina newyorkensis 2681]